MKFISSVLSRISHELHGRRLGAALMAVQARSVIVIGDPPGAAVAGATKANVQRFASVADARGARADLVFVAPGTRDAATLVSPGGTLVEVGDRVSVSTAPAAGVVVPCAPCARAARARGGR